MRLPALTQRIAHGTGFYYGHAGFNIHIGLGIDGGDDAGLVRMLFGLANPKSLVGQTEESPRSIGYLLLEPLSLGVPVKARCGLAKRPADSVCHLQKSGRQ